MTQEYDQYFLYLKKRSRLGYWYRRYWLYPRLCKFLQGYTLDVGCGIGDMLDFRQNTVGVDINPKTVAHCRERYLEAHLMTKDKLPFVDANFDSVILDNVLEHIAHPNDLLQEIGRVLRPMGTLVVGVPGLKGFEADPDHKVYYDEKSLKATIQSYGFRWQRTLSAPVPLSFLSRRLNSFCLYGVFRKEVDA